MKGSTSVVRVNQGETEGSGSGKPSSTVIVICFDVAFTAVITPV